VRQFHARVETELYDQATEKAKTEGISLSDLIRKSVSQYVQNGSSPSHTSEQDKETVGAFVRQLETKDEQIQQLHQLLAMGHQERDRLTLQIEDLRHKRYWWQLFKRPASA
jgi:antitoxin component of RelBE/YafQ-DinJ toxin-antitoxin module